MLMNLTVLFHVILIKLHEVGTMTNSTFLLRKLSLGEAKNRLKATSSRAKDRKKVEPAGVLLIITTICANSRIPEGLFRNKVWCEWTSEHRS